MMKLNAIAKYIVKPSDPTWMLDRASPAIQIGTTRGIALSSKPIINMSFPDENTSQMLAL